MTPTELRALYRDETVLHRMTSSAPPVVSEVTESTIRGRAVYDVTDHMDLPDQIGQNMSGELVALIGEVRLDWASYGPRHPIRRALAEWERSCRRRHRPAATLRWRDHVEGPLCGELLYAVVNGCSVRWCSDQWGVPFPRAERLIAAGVRFVAERYARSQDDALGIVHDREQCEQCREEDQGA